ncbi:hypothetical protein YC2023_085999 [Brassica napus]
MLWAYLNILKPKHPYILPLRDARATKERTDNTTRARRGRERGLHGSTLELTGVEKRPFLLDEVEGYGCSGGSIAKAVFPASQDYNFNMLENLPTKYMMYLRTCMDKMESGCKKCTEDTIENILT